MLLSLKARSPASFRQLRKPVLIWEDLKIRSNQVNKAAQARALTHPDGFDTIAVFQ